MIGPYATPNAFRAALEDRLRNISREGGTDLHRLRRRVAFDRLLARLFAQADPPWLLKGGYALELRLTDRARSTLDLDLSVRDPGRLPLLGRTRDGGSAVAPLHQRLVRDAERDLSDGFAFAILRPGAMHEDIAVAAVRFPVEARLAGRVFARFHLDVGAEPLALGKPEWVQGMPLLSFAGIAAARVALYPLDQQFAEKVHAYTFPWQDRDNTRVKDLVDLVLLISSGLLSDQDIARALQATFEARNTHPLPRRLPTPPADWAEAYEALARELGLPALALEDAYAYVDVYWQERGLGQNEE